MTTAGIKLSLDAGEFISGAGRAGESLHLLKQRMQEAQKQAEESGKGEDYEKFFKLKIDHDRLSGNFSQYERNLKNMANNPRMTAIGANGQQVFKMDAEYTRVIKDQITELKKLREQLNDALRSGDEKAASALLPQVNEAERKLNKTMEEAAGGGKSKDSGAAAAVKALGIGQIAQAIAQGFSQYTRSKDRTASISAYGSGDLMGGNLAEMRRKADFWGGIVKIAAPLAGTGLGAIAGNPMLGGMLGSAGGSIIADIIADGTIEEANKIAYASLWSQQIPDMMSLAAITGDPTRPKKAFDHAVSASQDYGYSAEEGAAAIRAAAQQGLDVNSAIRVSRDVFNYERSTGADRNSLLSLATMSERYGDRNSLRNSWAGLQATGMKTAQYGEFLRGMERAMTDGISKGWVRSSDEVSRNLTMLSQMTGGNPLWQGEMGAQRLMKMYGGFEGATDLQDSTDILAFRAARNVMPNGENARYSDVMEYLENPKNFAALFNEFKNLVSTTEGGDHDAMVEHFRKQFNMTYHEAGALARGETFSDEQIEAIRRRQPGLPDTGSREQDAMRITSATVNQMIITGQIQWEGQFPSLRDALETATHDRINARMENRDYNSEYADPVRPMPSPRVYDEGDYSGRLISLLGQYGVGAPVDLVNPFMADYNMYRSGTNGHDTKIDKSEVEMLIPYLIEMARSTKENTDAINSLISELDLEIEIKR